MSSARISLSFLTIMGLLVACLCCPAVAQAQPAETSRNHSGSEQDVPNMRSALEAAIPVTPMLYPRYGAVTVAGDLPLLFEQLHNGRPVIAAHKRSQSVHFVVVVGRSLDEQAVAYFDPAKGMRSIPIETFETEWARVDHVMIVIAPLAKPSSAEPPSVSSGGPMSSGYATKIP